MKSVDMGFLVTFLLLGAISSVVPIVGPILGALIGSYHISKKISFSLAFFSFLAFMIGTVFVTWFMWLSEVKEFPGSNLAIMCLIVSAAFWTGYSGSKR